MINLVLWRLAALIFFAGAAWGVMHYPLAGAWLGAGLVLYAGLLWRFPAAWLLVLPALLPVLDLTPWSGWFYFEEIDVFVLLTLALGYWRAPGIQPDLRLSVVGAAVLGLLTISYGVSAYVGLMPLSPLDANAFASYMSHYNALRILKGFVWAMLLLPLLMRARAQDAKAFSHWLVGGMLLGLAGVTLASWWERWTFGSLLDFASDYRITAMFSAMHTGGAALDGFLALSVPFLLFWLMEQKSWGRIAAGFVLLAAASYAVFATFSRGLYLAYGLIVVAALIGLLRESPAVQDGKHATWLEIGKRFGPAVGLLLLAAALLWQVFGEGGYRGLAAFVLFYAAIGLMVPLLHGRKVWLVALLIFPLAVAVSWMMAELLVKGPYFVYVLSLLLLLLAGDLITAKHAAVRRFARWVAAAALVWVGINAAWVTVHWGGAKALPAALLAAGAAGLLLLWAMRAKQVWTLQRHTVWMMGIGLFAIAMAVPSMNSYRMQGRFSEVSLDFSGRIGHWRSSLSNMDTDATWLGMGLGRFPESFYWKNPAGEFPGTYRITTKEQSTVLELGGAKAPQGVLEPLHVGQRIGWSRPDNYQLSMEVRSVMPKAKLIVELCEKWLLYRGVCSNKEVTLPGDGHWQKIEALMRHSSFGGAPWYARPTLQLSLVNSSGGSLIEVGHVSLKNSAGEELIRNGDFLQGLNGWFFTSDHHHLPWHAKNVFLNVYFDQGVLGLTAFVLLLGYVFFTLLREAPASGVPRLALGAALLGFIAVGLFDSLLDVPRLTWLFYLLVFSAMLRPRIPTSLPKKR